jgi:hypothetical protein
MWLSNLELLKPEMGFSNSKDDKGTAASESHRGLRQSVFGRSEPLWIPGEPFLLMPGRSLLRRGNRIGQHYLRQAILIPGIGVGDVGFGLAQFRLAELHDGSEAQMVSLLR